MIRKKSTLSVLVLTAALLLGGHAVANASDCPPPDHKDCPVPKLTQEQIKAFKECHDTLSATSLPLRQQKIVKKAELKAEMMSPTPNPEKVLRLHRELGDLKGKLAVARIRFQADCMAKGLPPLPKWIDWNNLHHGDKKGRDCR